MDRDWRLQATGNLSEDWNNPWDGQVIPKGSRLTVVTVAKLNSKKQITIPVPNGSAILLSASQKSHSRAKELRAKSKIDSSIKKEVEFLTEGDAFDFLEDTIQSIILALAAIEAFANEVIPDNFEYAHFRKSKIILETANKQQIERYISLEEKLDQVLPEVLGVKSLKNHRSWSEFKKLKKLRDRIIHMKTQDRKSSGPENDTLWHQLLILSMPHKTAFDVIRYFTSKMDSPPQWVEYASL
ncbi:hypothetical protein [Methylophaga pinxianii]|uniref:hypothetical protein n=1 Tax=Methylophaga pinxianii TaxID=2881052 RepID=UPI001CF1C886|nr:hypothetical protein [Methylophaga pinxianii]MCB2427690.1 hypothetical protein [Methylophaga pinxianii]UPH46193.1 hypothetical protein LGT42_002615 [Methylophaga pinxianii]